VTTDWLTTRIDPGAVLVLAWWYQSMKMCRIIINGTGLKIRYKNNLEKCLKLYFCQFQLLKVGTLFWIPAVLTLPLLIEGKGFLGLQMIPFMTAITGGRTCTYLYTFVLGFRKKWYFQVSNTYLKILLYKYKCSREKCPK
jgi:hypothetical protein